MKFAKKYEEYMQGREKELPVVGLKKLKKMLKRCRRDLQTHQEEGEEERAGGVNCRGGGVGSDRVGCPGHCPGIENFWGFFWCFLFFFFLFFV